MIEMMLRRPHEFKSGAVASVLLAAVLCMFGCAQQPGPTVIGTIFPLAGIDGGDGLSAMTAIRLRIPLARLEDSSGGGFQNPHRDEGSDNDVDVANTKGIVRRLAASHDVLGVISGLRSATGDLASASADEAGLPAIVLHRNHVNSRNAFCICASRRALIRFARRESKRTFGHPLAILTSVDGEDAFSLQDEQGLSRGRLDASNVRRVESSLKGFKSALLLVVDRPPALVDAAALLQVFNADYLRSLRHREGNVVPKIVPARSYAYIDLERTPSNESAKFVASFHSAAGFLPRNDDALAYAAAQVFADVQTRNSTRSAVLSELRTRTYSTILGRVRFGLDGYLDAPRLRLRRP